MRKKHIILCLIILLSFSVCKKGSAAKTAFINANGGLRMRAIPSLKGKYILTIPDKEKVQLLKEEGDYLTIGSATGKWSHIHWKGKKEWVFGGFLSAVNKKNNPVIPKAKDSDVTVIHMLAYLKEKPSWKSKTLMKLYKGEPVNVVDGRLTGSGTNMNHINGYGFLRDYWKKIQVRGKFGWVHESFIAYPDERYAINTVVSYIEYYYIKTIKEKGFSFNNYRFSYMKSEDTNGRSKIVYFTKAINYNGGEIMSIHCSYASARVYNCSAVY